MQGVLRLGAFVMDGILFDPEPLDDAAVGHHQMAGRTPAQIKMCHLFQQALRPGEFQIAV